MTHDELRDLAASYALDAVSEEERRAFEQHLDVCPECTGEVASFRAAVSELAFSAPHRPAPASLRARVLAAVEALPDAVPPRVPIPRIPDPRPAPVATRPSGAPWWLAIAASLGIIVVGGYALTLRAHIGFLDQELREALAQARAAQRQLVDAQSQLGRAAIDLRRVSLTTGILESSDVVKVDLKGQTAAPQASGRAFWSRTRGVIFTANSLPSLPGSKVYQLWIVPRSGAPLSAGLLAPDRDGRALVIAEPATDQAATFAVTIEPAGGVPAPTGAFALVGAL